MNDPKGAVLIAILSWFWRMISELSQYIEIYDCRFWETDPWKVDHLKKSFILPNFQYGLISSLSNTDLVIVVTEKFLNPFNILS